MNNINSPCRFCSQRKLHCHSSCNKYIDFSDASEKLRQERHNVVVSKGTTIDSYRRTTKSKGNTVII